MIVVLNLGNIVWCAVSLAVQATTHFHGAPLHLADNPKWRYWFFYIQVGLLTRSVFLCKVFIFNMSTFSDYLTTGSEY